jgi:hypothetical protein
MNSFIPCDAYIMIYEYVQHSFPHDYVGEASVLNTLILVLFWNYMA